MNNNARGKCARYTREPKKKLHVCFVKKYLFQKRKIRKAVIEEAD